MGKTKTDHHGENSTLAWAHRGVYSAKNSTGWYSGCMNDQPVKKEETVPHISSSMTKKNMGSIAKLLWAAIDFFVFMGMSVESRNDGRQLVLKYFGSYSEAAEQRWQRFRDWCVWCLLGVPVGGVVGGWFFNNNPALLQAATGVEPAGLNRAIGLSCCAVALGLLLWLPLVLRGPRTGP